MPITGEPAGKVDGPSVRAVSAEALQALRAYSWPGNVREMRNVVQRALVLSHDEVLRLPGPLEHESTTPSNDSSSRVPLADQVRELKVRVIRCARAESGGSASPPRPSACSARVSPACCATWASGIARSARARPEPTG